MEYNKFGPSRRHHDDAVARSLEVSFEFIRFVLTWLAALIPTPGYFWKVDGGMTTRIRGSIDASKRLNMMR